MEEIFSSLQTYSDFPSKSQIPEFTVSEVSEALKVTLENSFSLIKIRGEISGLKIAASGHAYFSLKDEKSVIRGICWRGVVSYLKFNLEEGLEVVCTGKISIYSGGSYYQIVVSHVEVAGVGALLALLEKRKKQLEAEGLFAPERKKAIPFMPKVIGVVTSPTGAVIRDIIHRISERFPLHVIVWPVLVQGQDAAKQITNAIEGFNNLPNHVPTPDVLIVARGGGSIEDLWAFNEEIVVRAAATSRIPLISAVGHETDTTLIDFASDKRAPTPTAAAEMAVPVKVELSMVLNGIERRLKNSLPALVKFLVTRLDAVSNALYKAEHLMIRAESRLVALQNSLKNALLSLFQRYEKRYYSLSGMLLPNQIEAKIVLSAHKLKNLTTIMDMCVDNIQKQNTLRLVTSTRLIESFHYKNVLKRGFVIARDKGNHMINLKADVKANQLIKLEFYDGELEAMPNMKNNPKPQPSHRLNQKDLFE